MRCASYTTAEKYDMSDLEPHIVRALVGVEHLASFEEAKCFSLGDGFIFVFQYGCAVTWNIDPIEEKSLLNSLKQIAANSFEVVSDEYHYHIGTKQRVAQDIITLKEGDDNLEQMLAVSFGLSQSIKLSRFEERVLNQINQTKHIPQELQTKGKISLSRKQISKMIGSLFIERNSINLHSDILDQPSYFWDQPQYADLYTMAISDQDLKSRTHVLNTRLDILRELFEVLNDQLNNHHSALLEWIIIWLIFIEVCLTIFLHVWK